MSEDVEAKRAAAARVRRAVMNAKLTPAPVLTPGPGGLEQIAANCASLEARGKKPPEGAA